MPGLSKEDRERIQNFADTPMYARGPEMLVPESEDEAESAANAPAPELAE